jgi:hypothetical protein
MKVETEELLPIGRFARLSGLTVKALRHYDELGVLKPAQADGRRDALTERRVPPATGLRPPSPRGFPIPRSAR